MLQHRLGLAGCCSGECKDGARSIAILISTNRQADTHTHTHTQTQRERERERERETDRQTDRQRVKRLTCTLLANNRKTCPTDTITQFILSWQGKTANIVAKGMNISYCSKWWLAVFMYLSQIRWIRKPINPWCDNGFLHLRWSMGKNKNKQMLFISD